MWKGIYILNIIDITIKIDVIWVVASRLWTDRQGRPRIHASFSAQYTLQSTARTKRGKVHVHVRPRLSVRNAARCWRLLLTSLCISMDSNA